MIFAVSMSHCYVKAMWLGTLSKVSKVGPLNPVSRGNVLLTTQRCVARGDFSSGENVF